MLSGRLVLVLSFLLWTPCQRCFPRETSFKTTLITWHISSLRHSSTWISIDLGCLFTLLKPILLFRERNLAHLVQFIVYDEFAKFDYGSTGNEVAYGRQDPPEYDLRSITNRSVAIIYSKNDEWASIEDFESIGNTMKGKSIYIEGEYTLRSDSNSNIFPSWVSDLIRKFSESCSCLSLKQHLFLVAQ